MERGGTEVEKSKNKRWNDNVTLETHVAFINPRGICVDQPDQPDHARISCSWISPTMPTSKNKTI
jgi:hypothetical protein